MPYKNDRIDRELSQLTSFGYIGELERATLKVRSFCAVAVSTHATSKISMCIFQYKITSCVCSYFLYLNSYLFVCSHFSLSLSLHQHNIWFHRYQVDNLNTYFEGDGRNYFISLTQPQSSNHSVTIHFHPSFRSICIFFFV